MVKKMQDDLYNHLITIARSGYDIESGYRRLKKQEIDECLISKRSTFKSITSTRFLGLLTTTYKKRCHHSMRSSYVYHRCN